MAVGSFVVHASTSWLDAGFGFVTALISCTVTVALATPAPHVTVMVDGVPFAAAPALNATTGSSATARATAIRAGAERVLMICLLESMGASARPSAVAAHARDAMRVSRRALRAVAGSLPTAARIPEPTPVSPRPAPGWRPSLRLRHARDRVRVRA